MDAKQAAKAMFARQAMPAKPPAVGDAMQGMPRFAAQAERGKCSWRSLST
ncbi:MAG: hypothetical protein IPM87_11345 [Novosphingobium sp.]|nr:hypothetical protein [Novosphingobium sp.]